MTDTQLYVSVGLPMLLILVSMLLNANHFNSMIGRFGSLENRMTAMETRMSNFETRIETRLHTLELKFDSKIDLLVGKVVDLDNRITRLEERLERN